ncbi:MAG: hypothetical protein WC600_18570 [Desulfobaccales bacterium]
MKRQDNFDELCRRLLAREPARKPDWDLIWTMICFGMALVAVASWIVWGGPEWLF